ncbi:hypothetical protein V6N13_005200 [Hibiscus sabdariffa]|uniref:Uncharacterized protein n=1 Tax=Hibiscus sabdariffa TaxID=183260 RepID=A0ABR2A080_9ROSI
MIDPSVGCAVIIRVWPVVILLLLGIYYFGFDKHLPANDSVVGVVQNQSNNEDVGNQSSGDSVVDDVAQQNQSNNEDVGNQTSGDSVADDVAQQNQEEEIGRRGIIVGLRDPQPIGSFQTG